MMADWSFLTNHGLVLVYVGRQPDSTGLEIAQAVGITERAVRATSGAAPSASAGFSICFGATPVDPTSSSNGRLCWSDLAKRRNDS